MKFPMPLQTVVSLRRVLAAAVALTAMITATIGLTVNRAEAAPDAPTSAPTLVDGPLPTNEELEARATQLIERVRALQPKEEMPIVDLYLGTPGIGGNTPVAFAPSKGMGGVGITYQNQTLFTNNSDAQAQLALGFGNPRKSLGLRASINLLDFSNFGRRGSFTFLLHHQFNDELAVGFGVENTLKWGPNHDTPTTTFGVITKKLNLKPSSSDSFSRLHLSLGVGNGRFRRDADFASNVPIPLKHSVGVFGSASLKVMRQVNVFTEWDGNDVNVGASIAPFRHLPIVITPTFAGLRDHTNTGKRFNIGIGYGFTYD